MWTIRKRTYALGEQPLYRIQSAGKRWWAIGQAGPRPSGRRMPYRFECTFSTIEECISFRDTIDRMLGVTNSQIQYYEYVMNSAGERDYSQRMRSPWDRILSREWFEQQYPHYMEWVLRPLPVSISPPVISKRVIHLQS